MKKIDYNVLGFFTCGKVINVETRCVCVDYSNFNGMCYIELGCWGNYVYIIADKKEIGISKSCNDKYIWIERSDFDVDVVKSIFCNDYNDFEDMKKIYMKIRKLIAIYDGI